MFSHLSVSHSVHRGRGSAQPPWMQTPLRLGKPPGCRPPGVGHTLLDTDPPPPGLGRPQGCRPPGVGQTPQGWADADADADPTGLGRPPPRCRPPWDWADPIWMKTPPPFRYSQQVGGTHPTGMHTCSECFLFCMSLRQCLIQSSSLANMDAIFVDNC